MTRNKLRLVTAGFAVPVLALGLAACGGSSKKTTGGGSSASGTSASSGSTGGSSSSGGGNSSTKGQSINVLMVNPSQMQELQKLTPATSQRTPASR